MAGDEKDRPQYLQSLILRNILSETKDSIAETINYGYTLGPAYEFKRFFDWVRKPGNYDEIGMPTGTMASGSELTPTDVEPYLPNTPPNEVWCQHALVGVADSSYWGEQWVMINRPADLDTAWTMGYNRVTNLITIVFEDDSVVTFTPANYDVNAYYLYAYYITVSNAGTNDVSFSTDQLYIYKIGSGNAALDALYIAGSDYGEFYPFIPVRVDNDFLNDGSHPEVYAQAEKAYNKVTGEELEDLITDISENEDLEDIDHAYVVFGVSLNVVENDCRRYLFQFFEQLMFSQIGGASAYATWQSMAESQEEVYDTWRAWKARQSIGGHDETSDPEPPRPTMSQFSKNEIRIKGQSTFDAQYDIRIQWAFIVNGTGSGLGKPGAKNGDCWIEYIGEDVTARTYYTSSNITGADNSASYQKFRIYLQQASSVYLYLDVVGMQHKNFIYGGESVDISAKQALEDIEESGFIVPLHYATWQETNVIHRTQMATACVFLVFNSYEVRKQKWYESWWFKILLVVVIAIISVVFTGGAGFGLLGAHMSIGTALGFSGMTAAIVGSVANAMAALIVSTLIEKVATSFGVIGQIVAAVFMVFMGSVVSSFQQTGSMAVNWGDFLRADKLLEFTNALGKGVQGFMQAEMQAQAQQTQQYIAGLQEQVADVQQAYLDLFGYGKILLDPSMTLSTSQVVVAESPDMFLTRTLMTGSDIAELSQNMLYEFPQYSLHLPNAFA